MTGKREKPDEIVTKLRQVEVLVGQGMARVDANRLVAQSHSPVRRTLAKLGTPKITFYLYGRLSRCKRDVDLAA